MGARTALSSFDHPLSQFPPGLIPVLNPMMFFPCALGELLARHGFRPPARFGLGLLVFVARGEIERAIESVMLGESRGILHDVTT